MRVILHDYKAHKSSHLDVPQELIQRIAYRIEDYIADTECEQGTNWLEIEENIAIDGMDIDFTCLLQFDCSPNFFVDKGDYETPSNYRAWYEIEDMRLEFENVVAYSQDGEEYEATMTGASELVKTIRKEITVADYDYWG
jgi:hypothetical protein